MPALIPYLLKINIALILVYAAYRFALRPLTFYTLNRVFLASGIIFASAYPFIDLSDLFLQRQKLHEDLIVIIPDWTSIQQVVLPAPAFDYWQLLTSIFWTGACIMFLRFLVQLVSLYRIHRSSSPQILNSYKIRQVNGDITPFSFWQNIYINPAHHEYDELTAILQHEKIHVDEWHTLDVLLAEISVIFYWFNPGIWLIKQAVKENLEFITDRRVLKSGLDCKSYQYSLVRMIFMRPGYSLINNFSFISIKKRIMMMNKQQSSQMQISRYVLIVPAVILLTLIFTVSRAQRENKKNSYSRDHLILSAKKTFSSVESSSLKSKSSQIESKSANTEAISNAQKAGPSISEIPVSDQSFMIISSVTNNKDSESKIDTPLVKLGISNDPLFIVDGIITRDALKALNPDDISSMEVLRDDLSRTIYSEKAPYGVVIISTKIGYSLNLIKYGNKPASINGKLATQEQINDLKIGNIQSIRFLIEKEALKKYGKAGENGLYDVTTKY